MQLIEEAKVVEDALKVMGEPVRLRDLVELTKDRIEWKMPKGMTMQMKTYMKHMPTINKGGYGMYHYEDTGVSKREEDIVLDVSKKDKELLENFRKVPIPKSKKRYKVGDVVEGKINGIEDYGAFLENDEGLQGLIHITNIKIGAVDDVNRYFKVGDTIKAKIVQVKHNGKISLSTRDFQLPDYYRDNNVGEDDEMVAKVEDVVEMKVSKSDSDELQQVFKYIQSITGVVSESAKDKIRELTKDGMFKFTMALSEVKDNFEVDVSMMLAKAIEEKMSDLL